MNNIEFIEKLKEIERMKTSYMLGQFGQIASEHNIKKAVERKDVNNRPYEKGARDLKFDGFMFDCVNLIKSVLWGFNGDKSKTYGGATYKTNNVPDTNADGMIKLCKNVSSDFNGIEIGEYVWMPGHCGIYVGKGWVIECTPKWEVNPGVKYTVITNFDINKGVITKYQRKWEKHGKLPWIEYIDLENKEIEEKKEVEIRYNTLDELPDWGKETIEYLIKGGFINGTGIDKLDLTTDMLRVLVILHRVVS